MLPKLVSVDNVNVNNMESKSPWRDDQVKNLNDYQMKGVFHPFTCDRKSPECEVNITPRDYSKDGVLIATEEGWVCPCGKYSQKWAHDFMTKPLPPNSPFVI